MLLVVILYLNVKYIIRVNYGTLSTCLTIPWHTDNIQKIIVLKGVPFEKKFSLGKAKIKFIIDKCLWKIAKCKLKMKTSIWSNCCCLVIEGTQESERE